MLDRTLHARLANAIRALAMDAVEAAKSGHPGMPMGMADVATVLFTRFLKLDASNPYWPDRDRFVLSAGHGSMLLYSLLHLVGIEEMTIEQLKRFRQLDSKTAGHPEYGWAAGIETTTGPLGQGLATSVGMALAERHLNALFSDDLVDHWTYVIASDGDLMEGISHEAIHLAGHLKLARLIVLFDDNGISIDGPLTLSESGDQLARFRAAGWDVARVDGHDPEAVAAAIEAARAAPAPSLIACRTTIGFGAPKKAGTSGAHGSPLGAEEIKGAREALGWAHPAFEIPEDVAVAWRQAGSRSHGTRLEWEARLQAAPADRQEEFKRRMDGRLPPELGTQMAALKARLAAERPSIASRKASELALEVVNAVLPETVGGSADLTPSNNTRTKALSPLTAGDYSGRYVHYGIREHAMVAAMSGMALHGGVIPYGGTFLVFSDYCRPAIRLAALMGVRVIYVMTHDSIGLGEDGPTHHPVEHLAALRAFPNLRVFRPADAIETAECWEMALLTGDGPSLLALSRQNLPTLRDGGEENLCAKGAYEFAPASGEAVVSLFATGSEVAIAVDAKKQLDGMGVPTRVVSVPSFELFEAQDEDYRASVLGTAPVRIAVEAAIRMGWDRFIGVDGIFVGMSGFGESGAYEELYRHFGITADRVTELALQRAQRNA